MLSPVTIIPIGTTIVVCKHASIASTIIIFVNVTFLFQVNIPILYLYVTALWVMFDCWVMLNL